MEQEKRKVMLPGVKAELEVEIVTEDGKGLIRHQILEDFITKLPRVTATYKPVMVRPDMLYALVECTMTDRDTGATVTKVGEVNSETLKTTISNNFFATLAYQRAYNRAAIALLGLSEGGQIYSDVELSRRDLERGNRRLPEPEKAEPVAASAATKPEPNEKVSEPVVEKPEEKLQPTDTGDKKEFCPDPDTVIRVGAFKGLTWKEVDQKSGKWKAFIKFLHSDAGKNTTCNEPETAEQVRYFRDVYTLPA